jgi:hypothetical protein
VPPCGMFAQGDGSLEIQTEVGQTEIELKCQLELMDKLEQLSFNRLVSCLRLSNCSFLYHHNARLILRYKNPTNHIVTVNFLICSTSFLVELMWELSCVSMTQPFVNLLCSPPQTTLTQMSPLQPPHLNSPSSVSRDPTSTRSEQVDS